MRTIPRIYDMVDIFQARKWHRKTWGPRLANRTFYAPKRTVRYDEPVNSGYPFTVENYGFAAFVHGFRDLNNEDEIMRLSVRYDDILDIRKPQKRFTHVYIKSLLAPWRIEI